MKVFVTGAAGFLGTAIIRSLVRSGHEAIGMAIDEADAPKVTEAGGTAVVGDLSTAAGLALLREGAAAADGVITSVKVCRRTDVGPVNPDTARREQEEAVANRAWQDVNAACIDVLLEALMGTGKPWIYSNSTVMIGDMGTDIADETTPPRNESVYGSWQFHDEDRVIKGAERNIRTVSLRAGMIYGPHPNGLPLGRPHPANMHQQLWEEGAVGYYDDGSDISTGVHVDDYADLFVLALEKAPAGSIYYGGSIDYSRKELAEALSLALGYGGRTRSWTMDEARQLLGDGKVLRFLTENHRTTSAKAIAELGWKPHAPSLLDYARREAARLYGEVDA